MTNQTLKKRLATLTAAICLLPVAGFASTVFTMSGFSGVTNPSYSGGVLTIDYTNLAVSINGGANTNYAGTYVETYNDATGVFSLTQSGGAAVSLTIDEAAGLVTTNSVPFSLYSAPTSLTFNSPFLTELGLAANPPLADVPVSLQTIAAAVQSNDKVSSATMQVTITPEPSTFATLGIALLCGIFYTARKRSRTDLSR